MKYWVLLAALLTSAAAFAQPAWGRGGDRSYRHDGDKPAQPYQVADRDRDHRDADRRGDQRNDRRDAGHDRRDVRSDDGGRDSYFYRSHAPAFFRPPLGHIERRLPERHIVLRVRNHPYYYYGGLFYDYYGGSYVIVNAPIGAVVPDLPGGYISFGIGPTRYFYFGGTYYIRSGQQYEVVEAPPKAQQIVNTAQEDLIIYPAKGQSQDRLDRDRYECHRWAVTQTGFDPSANDQDLSLKPDYNRAMSACLEARGYVVK